MAFLSEVLTRFAVGQGTALAHNFYYACSKVLRMYIEGRGLVDDVERMLGIQDWGYNRRPFSITRDYRVVVPSRREFCECGRRL